MAGNGDEAEQDGPDGPDWSQTRMSWLKGLIDEAIITVQLEELAHGDVAAADRRARAITNLARAVKAVVALEDTGSRDEAAEHPEDGMSDNREPDPDVVAAKREELVRRLTDLHAILERKRAARRLALGDAGEAADGSTGTGGSSGGAAVGLADLGHAGWEGSGKDLCGGVLAE